MQKDGMMEEQQEARLAGAHVQRWLQVLGNEVRD